LQCVETAWHQSLTAGLVDWSAGTIGDDDVETLPPRSDSCGKSRWASPNYEYIS
jgi:hypothetical protein